MDGEQLRRFAIWTKPRVTCWAKSCRRPCRVPTLDRNSPRMQNLDRNSVKDTMIMKQRTCSSSQVDKKNLSRHGPEEEALQGKAVKENLPGTELWRTVCKQR